MQMRLLPACLEKGTAFPKSEEPVKQTEVFVFGILNTFIMVIALFWVFRRLARQFFYARRMWVKREMISSSRLLKEAKARFVRNRSLKEKLPEEIAARRRTIELRIEDECNAITIDAERQSDRIIGNARRQSNDEKARILKTLRQHLLNDAIARALDILSTKATGEVEDHITENGVADLKLSINNAVLKDHLVTGLPV